MTLGDDKLLRDPEIMLWAADGSSLEITVASDETLRVLGPGWIGPQQKWIEQVPTTDRSNLLAACREVAEGGKRSRCEHRVVGVDGATRWFRTDLFSKDDATSSPRLLLAKMVDVTEYKERETALTETARHSRAVLDQLPVVLFATDTNGIIKLAQGAGAKRLGPNAVGRSAFELFADAPHVAANLRRAVGGESFVHEGETDNVWWETRYMPMRGAEGAIVGVVGVTMDATVRKRAEQALDKVFHASPVPIGIMRASTGAFSDVNEAFVRRFGHSREEVIGKSTVDLKLWAREMDSARVMADAEKKGASGVEAEWRSKTGASLDVVVFTERVEIAKEPCVLGLFLDITERKRAEEELRRLYDRLSELDALKARFVANMSHELRTPLALVLGLTERMRRTNGVNEAATRDLDIVETNARIVLKHVNDLLDVAKLDARKERADFAEVDLARLVGATASSFDVVAEERTIEYVVVTPDALIAEIDPDKVQRVLVNLLSNAFKITPSGGRVRCVLAKEGERGVLRVDDSGPGVPPALRAAVFERFVQLDHGDGVRVAGTGLGLSIAKELAELHHGALIADASPEGGARFELTLPLRAPTGAHVRSRAAVTVDAELALRALAPLRRVSNPPPVHGLAGKPLVLVVEDNVEMRRFVMETLGADFATVSAADGEEGLQLALMKKPDAIVTDLMMPRLDGAGLLRAIRARPNLEGVPVIVLTAKADDDVHVQLLREGAHDYVTKPFAREELLARVGNAVAMKRARDVLQSELESTTKDVGRLAADAVDRAKHLRFALDSMRVAREEAERASDVKSAFLSMVSHELRTPITAMDLQAQLLRVEGDLSPAASDHLDRIAAASARLARVVDSLLDYANIQSGRMRVVREPTDMGGLVGSVVDAFRGRAQKKRLPLKFTSPSVLPLVDTDPRLLRIVVSNVVDNALKFSDRASVSVDLSFDGMNHVVAITDAGSGITQQGAPREPLETLEVRQRDQTEGLGLGLAIVRHLVSALDATIDFVSRPGGGTKVTITIPMTGAEASGVTLRADFDDESWDAARR